MFLLGLIGVDQGLVLQAGEGVLAEVGTGVDQDLLLHARAEGVLGGVDQVLLLIAGGEGVMFDQGLWQAGGDSVLDGVGVDKGLVH